jgi:hypothetical protein
MDQKIREAVTIMLSILRSRSPADPLCREELAKLLMLYREIFTQGEVYLEPWREKLKDTLSKEELELLEILHQALLYRVQDEEEKLEERAKQREVEVEKLLSDLEKEITRKKIAEGNINEEI